ncbi:MAG TPA: alpha/beta hydrolase-fold protein [Enhygromyxa sp.]|nr:alpha/beta hydrolase-fold protein [Enhygromyxa sp.]
MRRRGWSLLACGLAWACGGGSGVADEETGASESTESSGESESESGDLPPDLLLEPLSDCERLEQLLTAIASERSADVRASLIAAFVREVSYGEHGFPIAEANKLAIVHTGAPNQALALAGDFNGWDAAAHPLAEPTPGFYYAIVELETPPAGLYKLVRDGAEFFADPLARRFSWDQFGEYSQIDALPDRGHHERWPEFDEAIGELALRTLTVYLPPGAEAESALPVLYMHDGQNLFSPEALFGGWQVSATVEQAIADAVLDPLIIVGIDNTAARFDEYTQVQDVIDGMLVGGRADEYADFLVGGIKPFIESRYPAASAPEQVAVMGSSLGGLVSLYIGLRHADVFGSVASLSGTVYWGIFGAANPTIIDSYAGAPPVGLRIYLDSGGDEGLGCPEDGSDNYCGNVELADALRGWGWVDEEDLFYRWDPGAPHNEAAWADRLLPALVDWL